MKQTPYQRQYYKDNKELILKKERDARASKRKPKEEVFILIREEPKQQRISHIDDIERYARNRGQRYADIQKAETLRMIPKIEVII